MAMSSIDGQLTEIKDKISSYKTNFKQKIKSDKLQAEIAIVTMNT